MRTLKVFTLGSSRFCSTALLQRLVSYSRNSKSMIQSHPHRGGKQKFDRKSSATIVVLSFSTTIATSLFLSPASNEAYNKKGNVPQQFTQDDMIDGINTPGWVKESECTKAKCSIHQSEGISVKPEKFNAMKSKFYEVRLESSPDQMKVCDRKLKIADKNDLLQTDEVDTSNQLLHNTLIVLPDLLSTEECEMLVQDAERILEEKKRNNIGKGVKTESWTIYSSFESRCQKVMKRILENVVLDFIEARLPQVDRLLFRDHKVIPKGMPMEYYWDDPVVIKYKAGNMLAPHTDDRDLTIVVPLNPLRDFPLDGGGTRFWIEGTTPELADDDSGVSLQPKCGSGILFNGNITHSGNSVVEGTRFVLMTSITLDEDDEVDDGEYDDEEENP